MYPLFESIKLVDGIPQELKWHQKRLDLSYHVYYNRNGSFRIEDDLHLPDIYANGIYKCKLSYNETSMFTEFSAYTLREIRSLKLIEGGVIDYGLKYTDRSAIDRFFERRGNCDDVLIVKNGLISDSSYTNIVLYDGSHWYTPLHPLLEGTQRNRLVEDKILREKNITIKDLKTFKSFKLINAMRDFWEIEEVAIKKIIY